MGAFKGKNAKFLTMLVSIAVIVVAAYIAISNKNEQKAIDEAQKEEITAMDKVMLKNLDESYPASVHEVIKYYCELLKCMFSGEVSDKQIDQMIDKERALFDEELLKVNEYSTFVDGRYSEIKQYKKKKAKVIEYTVDDSDTVRYWQNKKREMASIKAKMYIGGDKHVKITQEYILRKNDKGKWKILSWKNKSDDEDKDKDKDK